MADVEQYCTSQTIAVITSAPSFPFGIVDDIVKIGHYCNTQNICVHIDMCLGGFVLPFLPHYSSISFASVGITSISVDTHKYGCGPKGGSVILYRYESYLKHQIFTKEDWTGGLYGTNTIAGSRSGTIVSLTWATLLYNGHQSFMQKAKTIQTLLYQIRKRIEDIHELYY